MGTKRRRDDQVHARVSSSAPADAHHPRKRLHTLSDQEPRFPDWLNDLSDHVRATRIDACRQIILHLDKISPEQKSRIRDRLIKGICSSRKAARLGFSLAFTAFLDHSFAQLDAAECHTTLSELLQRLRALTSPPGDASNQEKKDYRLGRCLAYRACVQSKALQGRESEGGLAILNTLLDCVFNLSKEVPSLRQECGVTANSVLATSPRPSPPAYAAALLDAYHKHSLAKTPEAVAAWLLARRLFPELQVPRAVWHKDDPLEPKERAVLVHVLRDGSSEQISHDDGVTKAASGRAQRAPSHAWEVVLGEVLRRSEHASKGGSYFNQFWKECVDDAFFSAKASAERKAIGLQIVCLAIAQASPADAATIFAPNVVRCIINQRSNPSNNLHRAAEAPFRALCSRARKDPQASACYLRILIKDLGLPHLDKLTRSKTIDELLDCLNADGTRSVISAIDDIITQPVHSDQIDTETCRRACADLLLALTRKQRVHDTGSGQSTIEFPCSDLLNVFVKPAYLVRAHGEPFSGPTRELFQTRLTSCLRHTLESGADKDLSHAASVVLAVGKTQNPAKYKLALQADEAIHKVVTKSRLCIKQISQQLLETTDRDHSMLQAFRLLFALSVLQVHNGDADAVSILEELHEVYESRTNSDDMTASVVEILLGFLSRSSTLFRALSEQVFTAICPQLTLEGLQALLDVLNTSENLRGQTELFNDQDEMTVEAANEGEEDEDADSATSSSESNDIDGASDVEVVDANGDAGSNRSSDGDGSSTSEEEGSHGDDSDTASSTPDGELNAFEAKLAQTLGTSRPSANGVTADDGSSDESDMDDEQMMQLDGHLTKIFQERTKQSSKKKDNKDAKGNVIQFKTRVLDLLAIYVKRCHSSPLVLSTILPLLDLVRTTTSKALSSKAFGVLKSLADACTKRKAWPDADPDELIRTLRRVHDDQLRASTSKLHAGAASRAGLFLVKTLVGRDRAAYAAVSDMYAALQKDWFADPKSRIPGLVFTEWTSWSINSRR